MHTRLITYPGHIKFARNLFSVLAAALLGYRIIRAADVSVADAITSTITGLTLVGATATGAVVRLRELRQRAEQAEQKVIQLRDNLLEGDEDRALWDSVEPAADDEDTCKFGLNVIAINQARLKQAG